METSSKCDPGNPMKSERNQVKQAIRRLLAVAAILAVALLATHAVSHWHLHAYDETHCQVCHIGHVAIPQPAVQAVLQPPRPIAALRIAEEFSPHLDFVGTVSIPRAPPA